MNLQVIEPTWRKIEAEAKSLGLSTSEFVRSMIFVWRDECKTRKIPEFKTTDTINVHIYTTTRQRGNIKEATKGLEHKQFIETSWAWYVFQSEKPNAKLK